MQDVKGRIHHLAVNLNKKILSIAALGNNTVEVPDLTKGTTLKSLKGVEVKQADACLPEQSEVAGANGVTGECVCLNAGSFEKTAIGQVSGVAANIQQDAMEKKI